MYFSFHFYNNVFLFGTSTYYNKQNGKFEFNKYSFFMSFVILMLCNSIIVSKLLIG